MKLLVLQSVRDAIEIGVFALPLGVASLMSALRLRDFTRVVPSCGHTERLSAAVELMLRDQADCLVLLDERDAPLGVMRLPDVLAVVLAGQEVVNLHGLLRDQGAAPVGAWLRDHGKLMPVSVFPADLLLEDFGPRLQEASSYFWVVVQAGGGYGGMLDPQRLLKHWALGAPGELLEKRESFQRDRPLLPGVMEMRSPSATWVLLEELLEALPMPLMLQEQTGAVLLQNCAWRSTIGPVRCLEEETRSPWESVGHCRLGVSHGPQTHGSGGAAGAAKARSWEFTRIALSIPPELLPILGDRPSRLTDPSPTEWFSSLAQEPLWSWEALVRGVAPVATLARDAHPRSSAAWQQPLWLVVAQDLTEHQQVTQELIAKNADLAQLNRLKDEFLACISHELRTPLTAVLGLSGLLKEQMLGDLNERQVHYTQLIYQSGRHLMNIVNDILDLTRIETGQLELQPEPVAIATVCERAFQQALQLCSASPPQGTSERTAETPTPTSTTPVLAPFTLSIEPGLEFLVADEMRLRQMLLNLLSNALKFTDVQGQVGLSVSRWEGWVAFTVWDKGIGIPANKQHLIFQKFQQLENPLTRRFEGIGLGLVLTQRLARLHGGDITFVSREGEGSEFTLLLPPSPPKPAPEGLVRPATPLPTLPNRLVLIVEAVPAAIEGLRSQLLNLGYCVAIARAGTEAVEKVRRLQPCAVLLNPVLPMLSGWDVLTLLKSDADTQHIPVIVMATPVERDQARRNHADGFLTMPAEAGALEALLQRTQAEEPVLSEPGSNLVILRLCLREDGLTKLPSETAESHHESTIAEDLNQLLHLYHYRLLEADDLDQAELVARVWQPHVVLIDCQTSAPEALLNLIPDYTALASLPFVTLDAETTQILSQMPNLAVYPCLLPGQVPPNQSVEKLEVASLFQAIQIAAGMNWRPRIMLLSSLAFADLSPELEGDRRDRWGGWLTMLMQYLQTAGFHGVVGQSWKDVQHQIQHHSVDLLLVSLWDCESEPAMLQTLAALEALPQRPPLVILDRRLQGTLVNPQPPSEFEQRLARIAREVLPPALSMGELLDHIHQALAEARIPPDRL